MFEMTTGTKLKILNNIKSQYATMRYDRGPAYRNKISSEEKALHEATNDITVLSEIKHFLKFSKANSPEEKAQVLEGVLGILDGEEWEPLTFSQERKNDE